MSKSSDTWSTLLRSDETVHAKEGPTAFEKAASTLGTVGTFAAGFVAEQVGVGTKDFVSRVLYGETYDPHQRGQEQEKERDKDQGLER